MDSPSTSNRLEVADCVHTNYALMLPPQVVLASTGTSPSFMLTTTVKLDTGSRNIVRRSFLCLGWLHQVCVQTTKFLKLVMPKEIYYRFCQPLSYPYDLEWQSTRLWMAINPAWKYSLALDLWIAMSTLFVVLVNKWNSLKA